jgi:hypothetical protein
MNFLSRRSFVQKLALGAGATLLNPIARTLVAEAQGQVRERKIAIFFLVGNGIHHDWNFTPPEFASSDAKKFPAVLDGPRTFTWPDMFAGLGRHKAQTLLIDGLANRPPTGASGHSGGYTALSCQPAANRMSNEDGPPGGITIDQHLAQLLGKHTRNKSVLYGVSKVEGSQLARVFAAGHRKPQPHFQSPGLLFDDLFGTIATDMAGVRQGAFRQRVLMDSMRADVKRLEGALAGPERQKLGDYLTAVEEMEHRLQLSMKLTCTVDAGLAPSADRKLVVEDRLDAMTAMATLAVTCGLTNVVGVSAGCGFSHNYFPIYERIHVGTRFEAEGHVSGKLHDPREIQAPAMALIHSYHLGLIARMRDSFEKIRVGDRTLADNSVALYLSENGESHHADKNRWPVVLVGTAGGKLKADGRFLRYPAKPSPGYRSMADLYCTVATACGAPTDRFGQGGNEPVQGPLPEILA